MPTCSSCGSRIEGNARFCSSCGAPAGDSGNDVTMDLESAAPTITSPLPPRPSSSGQGSSRNASPRPSSSGHSSRPSSYPEFSISEGRFLPGRLIAGRYRIIALLGKGGMGEVYRADDLTLGQPVALKFLPDEAAASEGMLERFRNEVRVARRVSHPNVCRVYDVGEVDGQTFFTMEYVDGEDLASLLRRIGRLPQDKALEIARQLCAGLAAAHAKGVLHRDLKPANIMLDGRGQVVVTDFGLAGIADSIRGAEIRSGTPAYMAPEQLAGKEVSTRSDIYALGLVLYEVFTGKRAFAEKTVGALQARSDRTPSRPSSVVKDLDPIVERVILRCLEEEPSARPANALAIAGALPGGDPLAAALAAGETPSPQMVAAAGETAGLSRGTAVGCLIAILVGLALGVVLNVRYGATERMHLEQSPEVLSSKARELLTRIGYPEKPADSGFGFEYDNNFHDSLDKVKENWDQVLTSRPDLLQFWYRQAPDDLSPAGYHDMMLTPGALGQEDPEPTLSGMINLKLDAHGRLIYLQAIPPQKETQSAPAAAPGWAPLFAAAELDPSKLQAAEPQWTSLASSDARAAWTGVWPGSSRPLRVEAAAWHGKPVFFALLGDWDKPWRMVSPTTADEQKNRLAQAVGLVLLIAMLVGGGWLARRNYRQGRGDRDGASRLGAVLFVMDMVLWLCRSHFVLGFQTFGYLILAIASSLLWGGMGWLLYLAIEPWIRRNWPQAIISWTRLISGQLRDAVVGRDILFGVAFGTLWILIFELGYIPLARIGAPPLMQSPEYLLGGRQALGQVVLQVPVSIFGTLQFFFLLLGLKFLLDLLFRITKLKVAQTNWIAGVLLVAILVGMRSLTSTHPAIEVPTLFLVFALLAVIVLRFGLVPLAVGSFTVNMLANVPFTADFSLWYAGPTLFALFIVVALAGWGFYHCLGSGPEWKVEME